LEGKLNVVEIVPVGVDCDVRVVDDRDGPWRRRWTREKSQGESENQDRRGSAAPGAAGAGSHAGLPWRVGSVASAGGGVVRRRRGPSRGRAAPSRAMSERASAIASASESPSGVPTKASATGPKPSSNRREPRGLLK